MQAKFVNPENRNPLPMLDSYGKFNRFDTVYIGIAEILINNIDIQPQIVYILNSQDAVFALTKKGKKVVCGHMLILNKHPKFLIFETTPENKCLINNINLKS